MKKFALLTIAVSTIALSGCVNQEQADAKMAKGCEAALMEKMGADNIKDVKPMGGEAQVTVDGEYRKINLTYVETGSFDETPLPAFCLFNEQWGMGKSSHTAILDQLSVNGDVSGKQGGVVQGDLQDFLKLTDAAARGMGQ